MHGHMRAFHSAWLHVIERVQFVKLSVVSHTNACCRSPSFQSDQRGAKGSSSTVLSGLGMRIPRPDRTVLDEPFAPR